MTTTEQKTEISKGLTAEQVRSIYFDESALVERPTPLYRIDNNGYRNYYSISPEAEVKIYTSVTTLLSKTMPTSSFLIDWKAEMGKEAAEAYTQERADYGTFLHIQCAELMINRSYNLDAMDERLFEYVLACGYTAKKASEWGSDLKRDVLAFAQFVLDCNVVPMAVEITLASRKGIAGTIDIAAMMDIEIKGFHGETYKTGEKKDMPKETKIKKRVSAIIDMKSGRKNFYENHEIQLHAYRDIWHENFPSKRIERVFNWSPKEWRTAPDYNLKDQTESVNAAKLPHLMSIAVIEESKRDNIISLCEGMIKLENGIEKNYRSVPLAEILKKSTDERKA